MDSRTAYAPPDSLHPLNSLNQRSLLLLRVYGLPYPTISNRGGVVAQCRCRCQRYPSSIKRDPGYRLRIRSVGSERSLDAQPARWLRNPDCARSLCHTSPFCRGIKALVPGWCRCAQHECPAGSLDTPAARTGLGRGNSGTGSEPECSGGIRQRGSRSCPTRFTSSSAT
jgi:hypothetical protein